MLSLHDALPILPGQIDLARADIIHMHSPNLGFLLQRMYSINGIYTAHTPLWSMPGTDSNAGKKRKPTLRGRLYSRFVARSEEHTSELQSQFHLVDHHAFPTRRSSDLARSD